MNFVAVVFCYFGVFFSIQVSSSAEHIPSFCFSDNCCNENEFRCGNGSCIPSSIVCEISHDPQTLKYMWRQSHCTDYSDGMSCAVRSCTSRHESCTESCLDLPGDKSRCTCNKGYEIQLKHRTFQCVDIDECKDGDQMCSQACKNTEGSFECSCKEGFSKGVNKFDPCIANDHNVSILYNSYSRIYSYNLKTRIRKTITWSGDVESIEYNPNDDILYWTRENMVFRSYLPGAMDGSVSVAHAQKLGLSLLSDRMVRNCLSVDWVMGYLFWLSSDINDRNISHIMMSKLDGRYIKTVHSVPYGNSLALDPENGMMYWSIGGPQPKIMYGGMNAVIYWDHVTTPGQNPTCLVYDRLSQRLYWVDSNSGSLFFTLRSRRAARKIFTTTKPRKPVAIDIFENYIYWVTESSNELLRLNKFGKGSVEVIASNIVNPTSLKIYYKKVIDPMFASVKNDPECLSCSHICLRSINFAQCGCPDGSQRVYLGGEVLCSGESLPQKENPLICNCDDKEIICNSTSNYRFCACGLKCPDGLGVPDYNDIPEGPIRVKKMPGFAAWKIITVLVTCILLVVCLFFGYKKRTLLFNRFYY